MAHRPNPAHLYRIKLCWDAPIHFCIIYICHYSTIAELSVVIETVCPVKPELFTLLPSTENIC